MSNITNIGDIIAILKKMECDDALKSHAATLVGPRTRGSTTTKGLNVLPSSRPLTQVFPDKLVASPGCEYYTVLAPELEGRLGAIPLAAVEEQQLAFKSRKGVHGRELYIDLNPGEVELPSTDRITIIVGPQEGYADGVIFTWHPGAPLASASAPLCDLTAVKLHNG